MNPPGSSLFTLPRQTFWKLNMLARQVTTPRHPYPMPPLTKGKRFEILYYLIPFLRSFAKRRPAAAEGFLLFLGF